MRISHFAKKLRKTLELFSGEKKMKFQSDISPLSNITLDAIPMHRRWAALAGIRLPRRGILRDYDADLSYFSLRPDRLVGHVLRVPTGLTPICLGPRTVI